MTKTLVLYFSATKTTQRVAEQLAQKLGADIQELRAQQPYTAADLNWHDPKSRTSVEQHQHASRVAVDPASLPDVSGYQTILLGHPVWWGIPPRLIDDALDRLDFNGKRLAGFATSGGSDYGRSQQNLARTLRENQSTAELLPGAVMMNGRQIDQWLRKIKVTDLLG
ncbi:flavodoxin [Levilactobacillus namurensis]|uniref:flavodoxin n=1 Tax=Levilactobacillus namurensis TaxID=380393 RepID=UPI00046682E2|nr:flavodoxin [Levilactobacillus namurensis]